MRATIADGVHGGVDPEQGDAVPVNLDAGSLAYREVGECRESHPDAQTATPGVFRHHAAARDGAEPLVREAEQGLLEESFLPGGGSPHYRSRPGS